MMTKKQKIWTIVGASVVVVLALSGLYIHGHDEEKATGSQARRATNYAETERVAYNDKSSQVHDQLFNNATNSKDPIIKSIALNRFDNNEPLKPLLRFFNVYYNWNTLKEYQSRPKKLQKIATKNVLRNKSYFGNGLDKSGGDYIDNAQLNSEFSNLNLFTVKNSGHNIDLIADVQYNSWHTDTDNQGTGEKWFNITYDTKQEKITSMNTLYTNTNASNSSSEGGSANYSTNDNMNEN